MTDTYRDQIDTVSGPARRCFLITPHDSTPVMPLPKAIRAVGAGTIVLRAVDSTTDVAHPVADGERIDVRAAYVRATGTTATAIIGYA